MKDIKTANTVDAIAAIFASDEHQETLAKTLNSKFDRSGYKPSAPIYVSHERDDDREEVGSTQLPSVSEFAKKTLGLDNKWTSNAAVIVKVTDKHRELAEEAIAAIGNSVMMKILQGRPTNLLGNIASKLEGETVTGRDIGLLSFVPKTSKQIIENAKLDEVKSSFASTSKALGTQGVKVFVTVNVFNTRVIENDWGTSILVECNDDAGNLVTFFKNEASKDHFKVGETYDIHGKIKTVGETTYSFGAIVNTLHYVRKVKK